MSREIYCYSMIYGSKLFLDDISKYLRADMNASSHSFYHIAPGCVRFVAVILLFVGAVGIVTFLLFFNSINTAFTDAITPQKYPNSQIIYEKEIGTSGGVRRVTIYYTEDDLTKVVEFMDGQMPGFGPARIIPFGQDKQFLEGQRNETCSDNPMAIIIGRMIASEPFMHCVAVNIYSDKTNGRGTIIEFRATWPSG